MPKVLVLFAVLLLALSGCGGDQFTGNPYIEDPGVGASAGTGATGNASSGGTESVGGSEATAGTSGSPGEGGVGGSDHNPQGGTAGQPEGGSGGMVGGSGGAGGSMAGSAGSGGAGGSGVVQVCTPNDRKCDGKTLETCSADGSKWESTTCDFVCSSTNGCFGGCTPGALRCSEGKSETCDAEGSWTVTQTCPFVCSGAGVCGGSCVPGTKKCDGLVPQTCGQDGEWDSGTACENVCSAGTCTGSCSPGTKQCNGKTSQTCQANGTWKDTTTCDFVCSGAGSCTGECVPGTKRCANVDTIESCSASGTWQTENSCPFVCSAGACTGICKPGTVCNDDGNECTNEVCASDGMSCTHPNKSNGTPCGSNANTECNKPDTCQAGSCKTNFEPSTTTCTSDNNACTKDACNGMGSCTHPAGNMGVTCRSASCEDGVAMSAAACNGTSTACPASTATECYGACNSGATACENPTTSKVDDAYSILATDNDASYLYASIRLQDDTSQIVRFAKSNNAKTVLYQDSGEYLELPALIVAGSNIYFSETVWSGTGTDYTGRVLKIATTGALQTAVQISSDVTVGFAKNSTHVFWSDAKRSACACANPGTTRVYSTTIGGTTPTTFAMSFSGQELSPDIEVDDDYLYVWKMTYTSGITYSPGLVQHSLTDPLGDYAFPVGSYFIENTVTYNLTATAGAFPGITKNGTHIFGNAGIFGDAGNAIFKVQGGSSTRLTRTSPVGLTSNFVADASNVYIDSMKISVNGGSMSYWSNHSLATLSTLTIDGTHAYFGSYGYWETLPYSGTPDIAVKALFKTAK